MSVSSSFSVASRLRSFVHAIRGLKFLLQSQPNAWIHVIVMIGVCCSGTLLRISTTEWCLIVFAIVSVWVTEALNTALEFLTDLVSPEFHPLAGKAKDVAAAAVLISAAGSAIIGVVILIPPIIRLF